MCEVALRCRTLLSTYDALHNFKKACSSLSRSVECSGSVNSVVSFAEFGRRIERLRSLLRNEIEALSSVCPLWFEVSRRNHGVLFWCWLVGRLSRYRSVNGLHYGIDLVNWGLRGRRRSKDGRWYLRFKSHLILRRVEPYYSRFLEVSKRLRREHPDWSEGHIFNCAWYKVVHDEVETCYRLMRRVCSTCSLNSRNDVKYGSAISTHGA